MGEGGGLKQPKIFPLSNTWEANCEIPHFPLNKLLEEAEVMIAFV